MKKVITIIITLIILFFDISKSESFSLIVLPDTQRLMFYTPNYFYAMTNWIRDNRDSLNIVYVSHVGDIVERPNSIEEWIAADSGFSLLEEYISEDYPHGVPYGVVPGDHDYPYGFNIGAPETEFYYNTFFGSNRFDGREYYGGAYAFPSNENNFTFFYAGNREFISINLDHWSYSNISFENKINWADSLLQVHSDKGAIIVSHNMLRPSYETGGLVPPGEPDYTTGTIFNSYGEDLFNSLKHNANLFMLFTGHRTGADLRVDSTQGREVYSMLANYQDMPNEGLSSGTGGWLKILQFHPNENKIDIKTYSPVLDSFLVDNHIYFNSSVEIPFNFSPRVNNNINNIYLNENILDTVTIQLDSIFRFIGGGLFFSGFVEDNSIIDFSLSSNAQLKIYNIDQNLSGETDFIITADSEYNGSIADTFKVIILEENDPPANFSSISPTILDTIQIGMEIDELIPFFWEPSVDMDSQVIYKLIVSFDYQGTAYMHEYGSISDTNINISANEYLNFMLDLDINQLNVNYIIEASDEEFNLFSDEAKFVLKCTSLINSGFEVTPNVISLNQNYPNPFNPITFINYELAEKASVDITIYDIKGRIVKTLVNGPHVAGFHSILWNSTNYRNKPVSAGVYLYKIQAGAFVQIKKMVLLE